MVIVLFDIQHYILKVWKKQYAPAYFGHMFRTFWTAPPSFWTTLCKIFLPRKT